MTESELVQQCRLGNREAQRELYARTCDRVYRLLLRMTRNPDDAFDLAQDTYVRAFGHIREFHGRSSVATWIYQIALNEARQFLRRRGRHTAAQRELEPRSNPHPDGAATTVRLDMEAALDRLPEFERSLIILRHFEERSYDQMAEILEVPPGTVASGLNRARRMLREELEREPRTRD